MVEIYDDDPNEQNDDCVVTTKDCVELAKQCLQMFFRNRVDEYGFDIEIEDLLTDRNISLTLNLTVRDDLPVIYDALKQHGKKEPKKKGKFSEDVELVLKILNECSRMSIPKNLATGLLAVYIEVCKGCKLDI